MQMRAGGTVGGVCAAKVAEAEVMVEGGINDIFIANQVVGAIKSSGSVRWPSRPTSRWPSMTHAICRSCPRWHTRMA